MAETEEGLWMSAKERDRLKVLHEVRKRHITQRQAAAELGISVRWVGMLLKRLRVHGDRGLRHRLRGKRSNRKAPEELKQRAVGTVSAETAGQALARLWTNLGGRRTVRAAWDPHQPRDAAPLAHRGQAMAAAAGTCGTSPCVASAACALWRTGAMGHQ